MRFPEDGEEICSKHFVNGNHEQYISSPSYAPSLSMPENSVTKIDNSMYTFELTKKCIIDDCTNIRGENPEIKFYKAKVCKKFRESNWLLKSLISRNISIFSEKRCSTK